MDWITIIGIITGSGVTGLFTVIFTLRYVRNQEKGKGIQEVAKGNQEVVKVKVEEANALDGIDAIYTKMVDQVNKRMDDMQKDFDKMKTKLDEYVSQCTACPNNKIK